MRVVGFHLGIANAGHVKAPPQHLGRRSHDGTRLGQVAQALLEREPEGPAPTRHHRAGDLAASTEQAGNVPQVGADRRVAEREMRLFRGAVPIHQERDFVHVDRLAGEDPLEQRCDVSADLRPNVEKRAA